MLFEGATKIDKLSEKDKYWKESFGVCRG